MAVVVEMLWRLVTDVPLPDNVAEAVDVVVPAVVQGALRLLFRLSLRSAPPCTGAGAAEGELSPPAAPFSEDLLHW